MAQATSSRSATNPRGAQRPGGYYLRSGTAQGRGVLDRRRGLPIGVGVDLVMAGDRVGDGQGEADVRGGRKEDPEARAQGAGVQDLDQHFRVSGVEDPEESALPGPQAGR